MAAAVLSCCSSLTSRLNNLSITATATATATSSSSSPSHCSPFRSIAFSSSLSPSPILSNNRGKSFPVFDSSSSGCPWIAQRSVRRSTVVCEATPSGKKADSAAKRARQNEKRRLYHKAHKSEVRTRMRKVLVALLKLRKKKEAQPEEVIPIETLIAEAYSVIDKAVKVGTLHRNTGARRKSRLARGKRAVAIRHGWYSPSTDAPAAVSS
ncbi:30S ribosomal protein S20, chloroplastic [Linum perenne]